MKTSPHLRSCARSDGRRTPKPISVIPADIVEEVDRSEMIPHEVYGAHFVSWSDSIFSCLRPGVVYQ